MILSTLLLVLPLPESALSVAKEPAPQEGEAPDGHRSLGASANLAEVLALFRRPTDQDEEFLHGLARLEEEVGVLAATAASLYRSRGTFVVLDPSGEQTLEALHRALEDFLAAPEPFLAAGGERGRVWAQLLFDTRSRIRAEILRGRGIRTYRRTEGGSDILPVMLRSMQWKQSDPQSEGRGAGPILVRRLIKNILRIPK